MSIFHFKCYCFIIITLYFFIQRDDPEQTPNPELMFFGKHLFSKIAGKGKLYCHLLNDSFWGSMKSAGFVFKK